jgi:transposase
MVDKTVSLEPDLTVCPCCGEKMVPDPDSDVKRQKVNIPLRLIEIIEHIAKAYKCPHCNTTAKGQFPEGTDNSLIEPALAVFIVCLKMEANASIVQIQKILAESFGFEVSTGTIDATLKKIAECLEEPYQEIHEDVKNHDVPNVDETSRKENGKKLYAWIFCTTVSVLFVVGFRDIDILKAVLGLNYTGTIGCDYYAVCRAFKKIAFGVFLQHCLSRLKRDFKSCRDNLDP